MNERGTSFLEAIISCLLIGLFATFGITSIDGYADTQNLQAACQLFVFDLSRARVQAISANLPVTIRIRQDRRAYTLEEPGSSARWYSLPDGVVFASTPSRPVVFYSRGSATPAGTYTLQSDAGRLRVIVSPGGRSRWETE